VLVTGGAGFIGANFVRLLRAWRPEARIVNLDALTYAGSRAFLPDEDDHHVFVHGDIRDVSLVRRWVAEVDTIVHFAAESHVDRSIDGPSTFVETNVLGTQVLLDAARTHGVARFVHVSTDEVYGALGPTGVFTEDSPLAPSSPYSASKAASDLLALAYAHTWGLPVVVTRCSNNYGPRQHPEKLIPCMIARALRDEPLPVFGDGSNVRDWIHVEDHCRGVLAALEHGAVGRVYNFGARTERSNLDIVHALLGLLDKPRSLVRFVRDRPGHDWRYAIDPARAETELGWRPQRGFEEGLRATVDWYVAQRAWWEPRLAGR
jgi:dTDP-glucose 4,6-dehydratase